MSNINDFLTILKTSLSHEGKESEIGKYILAVETARDFCIKRFNKFGGEFGGQYTSHGPFHSQKVLEIALQIAERFEPLLNSVELFYLGLSAILHDIGMTAPLPEQLLKITDEDKRWDERRKRHGEACAEMLLNVDVYPELTNIISVNPDLYFNFLPNICAAHCTSGFKKILR